MLHKKISQIIKESNIKIEDTTDSSEGSYFNVIKTGKDLEKYVNDISETVRISLDQSISVLTPWFFSNMPNIYYQTTPRAEKVRHLSAVVSGNIFESKQMIELWSKDRTKVTFIGPGGLSKSIMDLALRLKLFKPVLGSLYFSQDKLLFIATFFCNKTRPLDFSNKHILEKIQMAYVMVKKENEGNVKFVDHFFENLDQAFVKYATPRRILLTYRMLAHMVHHEGAYTFMEKEDDSTHLRLTVGIKGLKLYNVIDNVIQMIDRYSFEIVRFFVKEFKKGYEETIDVLHFILVQKNESTKKTEKDISKRKLTKALRTLGWVDSDDYNKFNQEPYYLSPNSSNFLRAVASWIHILLGKENAYYYSEFKIFKTFKSHFELVEDLITCFRFRFDPLKVKGKQQRSFQKKSKELEQKIHQIIDKVERRIFREALKFVSHILKTNYFVSTKTGLAFRIDTNILDVNYYPHKPYGIFFIIGRDYRFFHIRWKDVARGGLRVVMPKNPVDYEYAISGVFDEVYGLSHAQQLKNKDIPEGGSKGVIVMKPKGSKNRVVKGAINALLDLLVSEDEAHEEVSSKIISYYEEEEIIYLGPDENMTDDLIIWAGDQARKRGYKYANAFMSSKPNLGINHKKYGVTSEGLHVYVQRVIEHLNLDVAKDGVKIKMTGGPDGDVAGNELKILHRSYGQQCKVVAIADGQGAAYDPNGLNWNELLKLVEENKSICFFNKKKLSKRKESFVIDVSSAYNISLRNNIHAHADADIFIPAGGRPYTVNEENVKNFIDKKGKPSCLAVVEGANIFFTEGARQYLQDKGVLMIKDSSANKTGVICSSFEIVASLILNEKEFLSIKDKYIKQVLVILRDKAELEAKVLLQEFKKYGNRKNLTDISTQLSKVINNVTDILYQDFYKNRKKILKNKNFQRLILRHCPEILREKFEAKILRKLPELYQVAILSSYCASYIVYKEGLRWITSFEGKDFFEAVITYMRHDENSKNLIKIIEESNFKDRKKISAILSLSGARNLTMLDLVEP